MGDPSDSNLAFCIVCSTMHLGFIRILSAFPCFLFGCLKAALNKNKLALFFFFFFLPLLDHFFSVFLSVWKFSNIKATEGAGKTYGCALPPSFCNDSHMAGLWCSYVLGLIGLFCLVFPENTFFVVIVNVSLYVCMMYVFNQCFVCKYVSMPRACLVPVEIRRGHHIP